LNLFFLPKRIFTQELHQVKKAVLLMFLVLIGSFPGFGQRFNFSNYTVANGLPGNQINKIHQDRYGRLWVCSMNGVVRFDGKTFIPFESDNILSNNPVKTIFEDKNSNLWFGTIRKGLVKYSGTRFSNYTTNEGLLSDIVNAICEDNQGYIWVGTSEGLSRFDGKKFTNYTSAAGLINNNIFDLHFDKKGNLWIATIGGLSVFDGKKFINYTVDQGLVSNIVYCIRESKEGLLWFGTYEGVSKFDGHHFTNYTMVNGLPTEQVEDIVLDKNGSVWMGTYGGGVGKLYLDSIVTIRLQNGVNSNIVKSIIEDREGNYWLGTLNGIFKYNGDRFTTYTMEDGLSNNNVLTVFSDAQSNTWFGTLAGGVDIFNGKYFKKLSTENGLKSNTIWCIYDDHDGYYWLGTTNGPSRFNLSNNVLDNPFPQLQNQIIYSVLHAKNNKLYFGTDKGIYCYENGAFTQIGSAQGLVNDKVRVLFEDPQSRIWVGTLKGVYFLDGNKAISFDENYKLPKAPVTSIINDNFGNILISTYDFGLIKYNPRLQASPVTVINQKTGLLNDRLLFNYLDSRNKLWLGTPEGVNCIDWETYVQQGKLKTIHYDKSNGFLGVESNAACEDVDGQIWFATVNGAIRFNPDMGEIQTTLPLVSISNIQLFLENVNWSKSRINTDPHTGLPIELILPHNSNHLSFICNAIYLTTPDEVLLRYKLEGFDEGWSPATKQNISSYSNIPPGSYVFKVQASLNGKEWSVPVTYNFTIRPPIWKTPFFYLMYIVVGAGSILLSYKMRTRSLRKTQELLRKKVESRTKELSEKNLELAKLSLVASETDNAVMIFDEHLQLEWVNTGYTKLTGFTLDEVRFHKGSHLSDLSTNSYVLEHLDDCIKERQSFIYESEVAHKDGQNRWASSTLTPILNENGQLKNIVVIDTDITLRKKMEEQVRAALEEKGVLLREIHHRVKNNLQIIISLFNLQTSYVQDQNAYKALKEGQDRIKSMALIHERFYQTDGMSKIDFDDYIKRLADNLFQSFKINRDKVTLKINAEKISLDIDTAVPCGLIINEIVSNSLKHAFKDGREGLIEINLVKSAEDRYNLIISDNGIGMPEGFLVESSESLGIQLIQALTDQLEGTMKLETKPNEGVKFIIDFKRII
jgi:PAS domain S-box-containing protein